MLAFTGGAHRGLVKCTISLGAGGPHRGSLAGIQDAELDPGAIGGPGHEPAQRVDLLDQMALADAADGRVAGHLADRLHIVGQEQSADA